MQIQENSAVEYQYLTCLNWAFAQLGVGSSPALATNVPEMAYCDLVGHGCSWLIWDDPPSGVNLFHVFFGDSKG